MPIFLYTDIEGSTQLWEYHREVMGAVLDRHDEILMDCIDGCGGRHVKNTGDGMMAVFDGSETQPLDCALAMQHRLATEPWPAIDELRIRIALHAGPAEYRASDYFGPVVNRVARLMSTAWGGQIILTPEVLETCPLPDGASLQDLGVHLLKDLAEPQQVYGLIHANLALHDFPALRSMSSRPNNLPRQPTPLVGREEELVEIGQLLTKPECRLLSLVAPGGMGKTRLGLQAAAEQIDTFHHGVFFVPLAGVASADNVPSSIANALNLSLYGAEDIEIQLHNYLAEKQLLLLLDNFEHLVDGAGVVADILATAPEVKVLVTSRRKLRLHAEWTFDVPGLSVPENGTLGAVTGHESVAAYGSVALFVQSARHVQPDFNPTQEELRAIVRICRLVDGMPLALELAAAWVKTLTCREIAAEIERDLDMLETEMQDIPLRQRSVRVVFEHSWNDLSPSEQAIFANLSVFRGGFTRDAAQIVTEANIRTLSELVNNSLLARDSNGRFRVHELLRQFAAQKLIADMESCHATEERHATYFSTLLKNVENAIIQGARTGPIEQINDELDNVLLAWLWAVKHRSLPLLRDSMRSLFWFYEAKAWYSEGEDAFQSAAEALDGASLATGPVDIVTNLRVRQAWFASRQSRYKNVLSLPWLTPELNRDFVDKGDLEGSWVTGGVMVNSLYGMGDYETARRFLVGYDDLMEREHDYRRTWPWAKGHNLANLGRIAGALGNYEEARSLLQEGVDILRPVGDHVGIMLYLHTLGGILRILGDTGQAKLLFQEGLDLAETHNYPMGKGLALGDLGALAYAEGEYETAKEYFESSLTLAQEIGDSRGQALALTNLGRVATALGDYGIAKDLFEKGLTITERSGNRRGTALTLDRLSQVHRLMGDLDRAYALCRQSWQICQELGYQKGSILALISRGEMTLDRQEFPGAGQYFQESLEASEKMGFVAGIMRSQIGLGRAALGLNDLERAEMHLRKGLALGRESRQKRSELNALLSLAETLVASGELSDGVQLLALTASHPAADSFTREKAAADLEAIKDGINPADFERLIARGRSLSLEKIHEG